MKRLFLFSIRYPFSTLGETFLKDEMTYLAKEFDEIRVIPLRPETNAMREMPGNSSSAKPLFANNILFILRGLFCIRAFMDEIAEFFSKKIYTDKRKLRIWVIGYFTINNLLKSKEVKSIEKKLNSTDVCYFYWGKWSNILAYYWKGKAKFVSRFHGFGDQWEDEYGNFFPYREKVMPCLDYACPVSKKGLTFLFNKYSGCKFRFSPLGSFDNGIGKSDGDDYLKVVSCSSVVPLKRVPLIFEALKLMRRKYNVRIYWTHIGGLFGFDELKENVSQYQDKGFKYDFPGLLDHKEVLNYYKSHHFDVFVNLSRIEGVPVSIMEALSFDIPIVATNVGGTSDVVPDEAGLLVNENPTVDEVASAIYKVFQNKTNLKPRNFWENNYNAVSNYSSFAKFLISI